MNQPVNDDNRAAHDSLATQTADKGIELERLREAAINEAAAAFDYIGGVGTRGRWVDARAALTAALNPLEPVPAQARPSDRDRDPCDPQGHHGPALERVRWNAMRDELDRLGKSTRDLDANGWADLSGRYRAPASRALNGRDFEGMKRVVAERVMIALSARADKAEGALRKIAGRKCERGVTPGCLIVSRAGPANLWCPPCLARAALRDLK